jgi:hypothetical protein
MERNQMKELTIYMIDFSKGGGTGIYIGATLDYDQRVGSHLERLNKRKHANKDLQYWFDTLGAESIRFRPLYSKAVERPEDIAPIEEQWMNWAVELHGRENVLNFYLKSHTAVFARSFKTDLKSRAASVVQTYYLMYFKNTPSKWFVSSTCNDMEDGIKNHLTKLRNGKHHDSDFQQMFDQHGIGSFTYHFVEARILSREDAVFCREAVVNRLAQNFPSRSVQPLRSKKANDAIVSSASVGALN